MNEDVKTKWVKALKTGKIDGKPIAQAKDVLRAPNTRNDDDQKVKNLCCLGVLCEIAKKDGVDIRSEKSTDGYDYFYHDYDEYDDVDREFKQDDQDLPITVMKWAGLENSNPPVADETNEERPISIYNDDLDKSFKDIAKMIEEQL